MKPGILSISGLTGALVIALGVLPALAQTAAKAPAAKGPEADPHKAPAKRAWLGTALANLTDVDRKQKGVPKYGGVVVLRVLPDSPASRTGFRAGDVIMRLDEKYVYKPDDIIRSIQSTPVGRSVKIDVIRNGGWLTATVKLTARPASLTAPASESQPPKGAKAPDKAPAKAATGGNAEPKDAPAQSKPTGERAAKTDSSASSSPAQAPSAASSMASRLHRLEEEVRSLRRAIEQMKRLCSR